MNMIGKKIGVGLIGANPDPAKSWGTRGHIPAINHLANFELVGICTSTPDSARAAAQHFAVPLAFSDPREMAAHRDIDVIVISVRTELHRSMIEAAVAERKHVYCEWPLGVTTAEAAQSLHDAERAGVRTAIGLQGRYNDMLRYARDLIDDDAIGKVIAVTMDVQQENFGPVEAAAYAYTADLVNGANLLSIGTAQALSGMCYVVGDFSELSAVVACQYGEARIRETNATIPKTSPDQVAITGRLNNGAVVSVHMKGGATRTAGARLEINGTKGDLLLRSSGGANIHRAILSMAGGRGSKLDPMPLPDRYRLSPPGLESSPATGVAHLYQDFAAAINGDASMELDFSYAVRWHRLIDAIRRAADTGTRQVIADDF
ncbi:Gfo/Idh/MocA family protein [Sphingobium mellinum]|uniref:Gfo/Idh/MocA family protein n=1 Tax=Sphingobium mellinum TaxID=1387166 RepID=UPI0030EC9972